MSLSYVSAATTGGVTALTQCHDLSPRHPPFQPFTHPCGNGSEKHGQCCSPSSLHSPFATTLPLPAALGTTNKKMVQQGQARGITRTRVVCKVAQPRPCCCPNIAVSVLQVGRVTHNHYLAVESAGSN
ncbi:hypothetical protein PIB30_078827 [Stylosanthes scabra]|uniref:Uncharacterized protein n=1 Tax=Stylosanthes scabra TaxID=79078 RepID=A0ABU6US72_9FABA|nr:hypothetical protein [Stylosanthes scabra]